MRKTVTALVLAGGTALLAACGTTLPQPIGSQSAPLEKNSVMVVHYSFTPRQITVPAGTAVTWVFNDGLIPHQLAFDGFSSPIFPRGGRWTHTFDQPGVYNYIDPLHDTMGPNLRARVVVTG